MNIQNKTLKLTLAAMLAALAFICFEFLRIELPMGDGMTGKIYIGHTFLLVSALCLGPLYGGLTGAIGLTLADLFAGYATSAPPTFLAKFLIGWSCGMFAYKLFHLNQVTDKQKIYHLSIICCILGCVVNIITEPIIRYCFKAFILGYEHKVAFVSAINCCISMTISAIPSCILAIFLFSLIRNYEIKHSFQSHC